MASLGDADIAGADLNAAQRSTAELLVANRLIEPLSEWALSDWAERTALPELLGIRVTKTTKDRLYHTGDALLAKRKFIEAALRDAQGSLFGSCGGIILYDVLHIRKATDPDAEQAAVYRKLGIDWKAEFPIQKRFVKR